MQNSTGATTITATVQPQIIKESRIQPLWHVIVLNVLTVGFYAPVWFFKTALELTKRLKLGLEVQPEPAVGKEELPLASLSSQEIDSLDLIKRVPPIFLMLGMALPVINFILGIYFFKMLAELFPEKGSLIRKHPVLIGVATSTMLIGALCLCKLPSFYYLSYCAGVCVPLVFAQNLLNNYWRSIETDNDLLVRHSFSTGELVMLIFGIMLLGCIIASYCIVPYDVSH